MPIPNVIEYPPTCFAIKELREHKYIELSYFTPEGRAEAAKNELVSSSKIFTLAKEDDILSLKPVINFKGSKGKALQDKDLAWDQVCVASTNFFKHIVQENWPINMIDAIHTFFFCLTNHKLRNNGHEGLKVLILYQARVKREWHRQIKNLPKVGIFDIGLIDDKVLRTLKNQIYDVKRSTLMNGELPSLPMETWSSQSTIFMSCFHLYATAAFTLLTCFYNLLNFDVPLLACGAIIALSPCFILGCPHYLGSLPCFILLYAGI